MGYTHYYPTKGQEKQKISWDDFVSDTKIVLNYIAETLHIALEQDITKKQISFNGIGEAGHETFEVNFKEQKDTFLFTKTARKPYDLAVCATLLLLNYHLPDAYKISSDGMADDWLEAIKLNYKVFGYAYKLPPEIQVSKRDIEVQKFFNTLKEYKELEKNNNIKEVKIKVL